MAMKSRRRRAPRKTFGNRLSRTSFAAGEEKKDQITVLLACKKTDYPSEKTLRNTTEGQGQFKRETVGAIKSKRAGNPAQSEERE